MGGQFVLSRAWHIVKLGGGEAILKINPVNQFQRSNRPQYNSNYTVTSPGQFHNQRLSGPESIAAFSCTSVRRECLGDLVAPGSPRARSENVARHA